MAENQRVQLPTTDKPTCGNCRFYRDEWPEPEVGDGVTSGLCCRYPPVWVATPGTATREDYGELNWDMPHVMSHTWCGEHQPKPID